MFRKLFMVLALLATMFFVPISAVIFVTGVVLCAVTFEHGLRYTNQGSRVNRAAIQSNVVNLVDAVVGHFSSLYRRLGVTGGGRAFIAPLRPLAGT